MNTSKDYYAILGVLPSAEQVVFKAAYKALSLRYHPDRYEGAENKAHEKMLELNEAYAVLSNPKKRAEYDQARGDKTQNSSDFFDEDDAPDYDPLRNDWELALQIYPDLVNITVRLAKISWKLSYSFKANLLEGKKFDDRHKVANC